MERFNLKSPLKMNILILKFGGLWPEDSLKSCCYTGYAIISFIFIVMSHNLSQIINVYYIYDQLETLTASIVVMLTEFMGMIKFCLFHKNIKTVKGLMRKLESDLFQPKNTNQRVILQEFLDSWKKIYVIFSISAGMTLLLWGLYPIIDKSYKEKNLPFIAWYPYNYKISPNYELTYFYQIIANYFIAFTNQNIDAFISALLMYIAAQCELLCDDLKNLDHNTIKNFILCIKRHQAILSFTEETNVFISIMSFGQFATSVIAICMTMFQLTVVAPLTPEFYTLVCCQSAVFTQVFVYCWFGNEVIIKSGNIPFCAYESAWMNSSRELKNNLIFFVRRSQKPIKLRAVNFFGLSLETFTAILRTSWSYFALLRQINK
ncbi:7tm 6 domain containing protein [Asbolus verrucosus]|uniref:Odorant receptor n=1 Tax=Asbolus verrucosus TaxID=1661398 RepID=A0A482V8Z7_ASBVE|nr:7tm 6 domain containing protein [Asbolus verrucosus]